LTRAEDADAEDECRAERGRRVRVERRRMPGTRQGTQGQPAAHRGLMQQLLLVVWDPPGQVAGAVPGVNDSQEGSTGGRSGQPPMVMPGRATGPRGAWRWRASAGPSGEVAGRSNRPWTRSQDRAAREA
jgi:hypothetical protein